MPRIGGPGQGVPPCECGGLERAAEDPHNPIVFDRTLNEYDLQCRHDARMRIYYCPICGGAAPESLRHKLFTTITHDEIDRLNGLVHRFTLVQEVLDGLGPPDSDCPAGLITHMPEFDGVPNRVESFRTLIYKNLSDVADLHVQVLPDSRFHVMLVGKYIGPLPA